MQISLDTKSSSFLSALEGQLRRFSKAETKQSEAAQASCVPAFQQLHSTYSLPTKDDSGFADVLKFLCALWVLRLFPCSDQEGI